MFWTLLLSHLLADYPLQTDRMVLAKKTWRGLTIHVGIHWLVMTILLLPRFRLVWPFILVVTILHFAIDAFKNWLSQLRPQWVIGPYLFDQLLHLASLLTVVIWFERATGENPWVVPSIFWLHAIAIILAGYSWAITERVLAQGRAQWDMPKSMWPRLLWRLILYGLIVTITWGWFATFLFTGIMALFYWQNRLPPLWAGIDWIVAVAVGSLALFFGH